MSEHSLFVQTREGVTTISFGGSLGVESGEALPLAILDALADGQHAIVVNLLEVTRIDAAGLGQLVWAYTVSRARGGDLKVIVREQVRELLERTALTRVLPTFSSIADALATFADTSVA